MVIVMNKLEVGMNVRTKYGHIDKIIDTTEEWHELDGDEEEKLYKIYKLNKNYYDEEFDEDTNWFIESFFVKASHNLLGNDKEPCLIEVGDYVNGHRVDEIGEYHSIKTDKVETYAKVNCSKLLNCLYEEDIKSIVTKEQFEAMKYEIYKSNNCVNNLE